MIHDEIIEDWHEHADLHDERNYRFLRKMKFPPDGVDPDELAHEAHTEAFRIIDCTRCANCCKVLDTTFTAEDIRRVAAHLGMSETEFIDRYLETVEEDDFGARLPEGEPRSCRVRGRPCTFLGEDGRCTIYEVRPENCREYPHTDKKGFATRTMGLSDNALVCPAVYYIIERMRERVREIRDMRRGW